jgi:hypothetical protein
MNVNWKAFLCFMCSAYFFWVAAHSDSLDDAREANSESIDQDNMDGLLIIVQNNPDVDKVLDRLKIRYDFVTGYISEIEADPVMRRSYRDLYWYYVGCKETLEDVSDLLQRLSISENNPSTKN